MQTYTIANNQISVMIGQTGAEPLSLIKDGTEYIWQGDPTFWKSHAPILFPICGRLFDGKYTWHGKTYEMNQHGFARHTDFSVKEQTRESITLVLTEDEKSLQQYPVHFTLEVSYHLEGSSLETSFLVRNEDEEPMHFGIGGHPGFNVPLKKGLKFSDYYLEFAQDCRPARVGFTPDCFLSGDDPEYRLEGGRKIRLDHSMFDEDAVFLKHMCREVTLKSDLDDRRVTLQYPKMNYLGIWHKPRTEAPYVCIEPWTSLQARGGIVEEMTVKSDLITIMPGETYRNKWTITVR